MERGKRIVESLRDPYTREAIISHFLVLYTILKKPGTTRKELQKELKKLWAEIHDKNPNFYLFWGGYNDGHNYQHRELEDVLCNYEEFGYVNVERKNTDRYGRCEMFYSLTDRGCRALAECESRLSRRFLFYTISISFLHLLQFLFYQIFIPSISILYTLHDRVFCLE